jgi:hypothetical protein
MLFSRNNFSLLYSAFVASLLFSFLSSELKAQGDVITDSRSYEKAHKPYARYWWFASRIQKDDVRYNLNWLKAHGFGGVELAWVYPLNRFNPKDTTYTPRQEWLSKEWTDIVSFAKLYADSIGMTCDLTFGTLWPFGDTKVTFEQASQRFGNSQWRQEINRSWEHPKVGYVVDHLSPKHYRPYFSRLMEAYPRPHTNLATAYFIDSWEVETEKLWCDGFGSDFKTKFGYDLVPFMDSIYRPANSAQLYDYMQLLSDKVLKFYTDFDSTLNAAGVQSRGQVSGAPCDLISGYALMDIPEGESMLFEPEFCAIPASAALLSGKKTVSSETFTCLYGWPRDYIRKEQTADLKLVADALLANGINRFIWHGKAHNPAGMDTVNFYATTHIGDNCLIAPEIEAFNAYLTKISGYMNKGSVYSDVAVYLPTEDAWTAGVMPKEKQFIWAWGHYEMRYVYFPAELDGYNPTWINAAFLEKARFSKGVLSVGDARYKVLYVDVDFLEYRALKRMLALAQQGLTIILKKEPKEPGTLRHSDYTDLVRQLRKLKTVSVEMPTQIKPFLSGSVVPRHWCRVDGESLYVFFPNPKADRLKFPMEYGQSLDTETRTMDVDLYHGNKRYPLHLEFKPYQSLMYKIEKGAVTQLDISFVPKTPRVEKRPADFKAPWLVK